jgi:hypothetical protein
MAQRTGNGGKVTNLGPLAASIANLRTGLYQAPPDTIAGVSRQGWYSPLQPIAPVGPAGVGPKGFQFNAGQNQVYTPRFDSEYSAADLKQLAGYDLVRVIIENVKDQIAHTPWEIHARRKPGEPVKEHAKREAGDANIIKLSQFFECPDGENMWPDWVRPLMEDMLVIDAGAIELRKFGGNNGSLAELRVLRGDSITRYIDDSGYTPPPPSPAYAQNWWGMPLVNLTTDQLVYKPRNIVPRNTVASQLYGMSPVEQAAQWIKIGALRLNFQESYYTDGAVPGMMQVVPPEANPDKIREVMLAFNSEVAGNFAKRRGMQMVQGFRDDGKDDQIIFTKEALLTDPFDDLIIRCLCFAFGTSPQRLMKMMNRASAEANQSSAEQEGFMPFLNWLRVSVINFIIQRKMGMTDYEMIFISNKETDPAVEMTTITGYVKSGIKTINEGREAIGDDASSEPNADKLGIQTAMGFVPIDTPPPPPGGAAGGDGAPAPKPGAAKPTPSAKPAKKLLEDGNKPWY